MDRPLDVRGIPARDSSRDESEAACAIALLLEAAVPDLTEAAKEDGSGEGVARLAFVEPGMNASAQIDALQPGEDKQGSFDSAQLAQGYGEAVLAGVAAQLAQHERSRHGALLDGGGEAKDAYPFLASSEQITLLITAEGRHWIYLSGAASGNPSGKQCHDGDDGNSSEERERVEGAY